MYLWNAWLRAHNKAFKRDSCRVAFLVCSEFCGESGLRKAGLGGIHPLTQRYMLFIFCSMVYFAKNILGLRNV
ncbi:DUF3265 domain-containing protein [Vibrio vulnificus]|nr:DUF3265 domain-containing protein [Vibrio vulnificus]RZQ25712.1 DUF3265 domain-containing protein [Vibrio vulnificus]RZQ72844.1 DUF3265 domain-containing protein [Vibrio vulnificus]